MMWTLEEALNLVRTFSQFFKNNGWFIALSGGVLINSNSDHDLDLVFLPMDSTNINSNALYRCLERVGMKQIRSKEEMHKGWKEKGLTDRKHVEHWETLDGKRVDVIIVS